MAAGQPNGVFGLSRDGGVAATRHGNRIVPAGKMVWARKDKQTIIFWIIYLKEVNLEATPRCGVTPPRLADGTNVVKHPIFSVA
jgi:hypothetical protein